ncbi:MAG: six-cysteine ranthipeptide SCIFF [Candidatus Desulforudaceae bacterium]|nr:six-cysteine ranthipeptide SCIFF [Bacillota bacterium]MBV1727555.1 six-cysteine ranthipeptide SCIFF [Desulforudis sp.]MDQ7789916.1 six-cysteine ranthipeptide SCIFF [Clostridia bacterium]MBU4534141.1 six-cysteine ranthipeptide SCIFF [Bacillota bacterium]MBU4553387.1 six-cysteine ranthipeptide SCIFF [Bacillota bacterium]
MRFLEGRYLAKHIKTITRSPLLKREHTGCGECQTSCQSACKTSCTVGNQTCLKTKTK